MKRMNLEGERYGKLVAVKYTRRNPKNRMAFYICKCDCGNEAEVSHGNLRSGHTESCGCLTKRKGEDNPKFLHGMQKTKAYKSWCKIKERCYCETNPSYPAYGAVGIKTDDLFKEDFLAFLVEVGEPPAKNSTIDRIDNNKGYVAGNMRWASPHQQARNKSLYRVNSSGVTGVTFYKLPGLSTATYAVCQWHDLDGRIRNKKFSIKKHGLLPAFKLAVDYRNKMIQELNEAGAGYSINHGKEKELT